MRLSTVHCVVVVLVLAVMGHALSQHSVRYRPLRDPATRQHQSGWFIEASLYNGEQTLDDLFPVSVDCNVTPWKDPCYRLQKELFLLFKSPVYSAALVLALALLTYNVARLTFSGAIMAFRMIVLYRGLGALQNSFFPHFDFSDHVVLSLSMLLLLTHEVFALRRELPLMLLACVFASLPLYSMYFTVKYFHTPEESIVGCAVALLGLYTPVILLLRQQENAAKPAERLVVAKLVRRKGKQD